MTDDRTPEAAADKATRAATDRTIRQRKATAYHEAGHAVMALALGRSIEKVTISPSELQTGGSRLGACRIRKGRMKGSADWLEDDALILFAGMVAESHYTQAYCQHGAAQDLIAARRLLTRRAPKEGQTERLARRLLKKTEHVLGSPMNTQAIKWIAEELLAHETISGRAARHYFERATQKES